MPPACGRPCSRTADPTVRKWKRVDTADGPRFRSALAAHEAGAAEQPRDFDARDARGTRIIFSCRRTRRDHGYADRQFAASAGRHDEAAAARLLPLADRSSGRLRHRGEPQQRTAKPARAGDHRRETSSGTTVAGHRAAGRREVRTHRGRRACLGRRGQRRAAGAGHDARHRPQRARAAARRPSDGRASRRVSVADGAAGVPGAGSHGQDDERHHRRRRDPRRPPPAARSRRRRSVPAGPAAPPSC